MVEEAMFQDQDGGCVVVILTEADRAPIVSRNSERARGRRTGDWDWRASGVERLCIVPQDEDGLR